MDYRDSPPVTGGLSEAEVVEDPDLIDGYDLEEEDEDDAGDDDAS